MINYAKYEGKLIRLNNKFPIYDREDENKIIGYTQPEDLAVITFAGREDADSNFDYFETVIVSGEFIGVNTLALNNNDIDQATFIFNKVDGDHTIYICDKEVRFEMH